MQVEDGVCIYKHACDDVGLIQDLGAWYMMCYDGEEPDELPDAAVYFDTVASMIDPDYSDDAVTAWADFYSTMKIPARDNFEGGWWIKGTDGWYDFMDAIPLDMEVVYNIGDAINKIGFGLVIYNLAVTDK